MLVKNIVDPDGTQAKKFYVAYVKLCRECNNAVTKGHCITQFGVSEVQTL